MYKKGGNNLIDYKCFYPSTVKDYYTCIFNGEKKFGRTMYLKEEDNDKISLLFIKSDN